MTDLRKRHGWETDIPKETESEVDGNPNQDSDVNIVIFFRTVDVTRLILSRMLRLTRKMTSVLVRKMIFHQTAHLERIKDQNC